MGRGLRWQRVAFVVAAMALAGALHVSAAGRAPSAAQETRSVFDGAYTNAQAMRGEPVYFEYCVNCHGAALEGGDMTPALTGPVFGSNWNGLTLGDLFERIRTSMPLDRPGQLSRQQNVDVIAFILRANKWPAGTREVPPEPAALRQITLETVRSGGR